MDRILEHGQEIPIEWAMERDIAKSKFDYKLRYPVAIELFVNGIQTEITFPKDCEVVYDPSLETYSIYPDKDLPLEGHLILPKNIKGKVNLTLDDCPTIIVRAVVKAEGKRGPYEWFSDMA